MTEVTRQLELVLAEMRAMRDDVRLLRNELRLARGTLGRLEDSVNLDVLGRLNKIEPR